MNERQQGAARRKSETAAIGPRRLARPLKSSRSGSSEAKIMMMMVPSYKGRQKRFRV